MENLLTLNPLILLFLVAAVGYFIGNIPIYGNKLGVAAVLFVGLAFGATSTEFNVPEIVFQLGLVLFVYSIGLSSGPAFFSSIRTNGVRDIGFVITMLLVSVIVPVILHFAFGFDAATTTGLYTGATTNTPALAGVIDMLTQAKAENLQDKTQNLVVGYTYSYPSGVLGVMLAIFLVERMLKIDYKQEAIALRKKYPTDQELDNLSVLITNPEVENYQLRDLMAEKKWNVVFARMRDVNGEFSLPTWNTVFKVGESILLIGTEDDIAEAMAYFGKEDDNKISHIRTTFDSRQIFVSRPEIVGKKLSELNIDMNYHAIVTRIRRGDSDMLARPDFVLQQGDRVRFVARRKDLKALSKFFGDSYFESSQVNIFSFGLGIAIGLLIGTIPLTLPGGIQFKLGYAGGPLLVSLILGAIHRTGNMVWTLPYSANVTLRQIGLTLLLAVIGLKSGNTFANSLASGDWIMTFVAGVILSVVSAIVSMLIGYKLFRIPYSLLLGFMSNQPAILDFGLTRAGSRIPLIGYSLMFPIALILKIVFAQILYLVLT